MTENNTNQNSRFLPLCRKDMQSRGIDRLDFVYVSGDAYVDHPGFAHAVVCRLLESLGYTVGIIAQPDWHTCDDFKEFGEPRLGFLVGAGNIDSYGESLHRRKKTPQHRFILARRQVGKASRQGDNRILQPNKRSFRKFRADYHRRNRGKPETFCAL